MPAALYGGSRERHHFPFECLNIRVKHDEASIAHSCKGSQGPDPACHPWEVIQTIIVFSEGIIDSKAQILGAQPKSEDKRTHCAIDCSTIRTPSPVY